MADAAPQSSPSSAAAQVMAESQLSPASDGVTPAQQRKVQGVQVASGGQAGEMLQWHPDGRELQTLKNSTERAGQNLVSALKSIEKVTKELKEQSAGEPQALQTTSEQAAKRAKLEERLDAFMAEQLLPEKPRTKDYQEVLTFFLQVAANRAVAASQAAAAAAAVSQMTAKDLAATIECQKELQYRLQSITAAAGLPLQSEP